MANLNVEPGDSTVDELIAWYRARRVLMETNVSWSIDDSRNKFQFGTELGRLIEDGELGSIVRNPNYRGISATFWRNLSGVADHDSFTVMAVGNCGKGEPNQQIRCRSRVAPHCRFADVEVFGGEAMKADDARSYLRRTRHLGDGRALRGGGSPRPTLRREDSDFSSVQPCRGATGRQSVAQRSLARSI